MRGVFVTGLPGVGKTTACRKVAELCRNSGFRVEGFITEELREHGARVGFDVVELRDGVLGKRCPLARIGTGRPQVGKYTVDLQEFESLALPMLEHMSQLASRDRVVCIVDELGKMELFSKSFVAQIRSLLAARPVPMLFTIALHGGGFIAEAKQAHGFELIEITHASRDAAAAEIIAKLLGQNTAPSLSCSADTSLPKPRRRWQQRETVQGRVEEVDVAAKTGADVPERNQTRIVLWLRGELRLADNPLLQTALQEAFRINGSLTPVFCYDPCIFSEQARTRFGSQKVGLSRKRFLEESLADLAASFERRGSKLYVFDSRPEDVLPAIAGPTGIVFATHEACPEELASEERVAAALATVGAKMQLVDGSGVATIFGNASLKALGLCGGESFPEDFRVFYDTVKRHTLSTCMQKLCDAPAKFPPVFDALPHALLAQVKQPLKLPRGASKEHRAAGPNMIGGETEAWSRLRCWLENRGLHSYKSNFRRLSGDYSSRLSAHLALGCIAPQRVCVEASNAVRSGPHVEHFLYEMCWRDFFRHVAPRWGSSLFLLHGPLRIAGTRAWRRDTEAEDRWRNGMTGVPLIDAAMRELKSTGFIGNLARQFVAAFLVEDLGLDWRIGADWFESFLVDYDPHVNWGQWARSAGVAPTNESKRQRVGGTRYFDLALALENDEAASYIRAWVPELAHFVGPKVFAPWASGDCMPDEYPRSPMCSLELKTYFEEASRGMQGGYQCRRKGSGLKGGSKGKSRDAGKGGHR